MKRRGNRDSSGPSQGDPGGRSGDQMRLL